MRDLEGSEEMRIDRGMPGKEVSEVEETGRTLRSP